MFADLFINLFCILSYTEIKAKKRKEKRFITVYTQPVLLEFFEHFVKIFTETLKALCTKCV